MLIVSGPPDRLELPPAPTDVRFREQVVRSGGILTLPEAGLLKYVELRLAVLKTLHHRGELVQPGALVWVWQDEARRLIAKGFFAVPTPEELGYATSDHR